MKTKFEKRLEEAIERKKDIEKQKQELLLKLSKKKSDINIKRTTGYDSFIEELSKSRKCGSDPLAKVKEKFTEQEINKIETFKTTIPEEHIGKYNTKRAPEMNDYDYIRQFIVTNINWYGIYQHHIEEDGVKYIDFEFNPSIEENDEKLDVFELLKGAVIDSEYKYSSILSSKNNLTLTDFIKQIKFWFSGKKCFIKKIRIEYNTLLEEAKKYGNR